MEVTKRCSMCKAIKDVDEFRIRFVGDMSYYDSGCRSCHNKRNTISQKIRHRKRRLEI